MCLARVWVSESRAPADTMDALWPASGASMSAPLHLLEQAAALLDDSSNDTPLCKLPTHLMQGASAPAPDAGPSKKAKPPVRARAQRMMRVDGIHAHQGLLGPHAHSLTSIPSPPPRSRRRRSAPTARAPSPTASSASAPLQLPRRACRQIRSALSQTQSSLPLLPLCGARTLSGRVCNSLWLVRSPLAGISLLPTADLITPDRTIVSHQFTG